MQRLPESLRIADCDDIQTRGEAEVAPGEGCWQRKGGCGAEPEGGSRMVSWKCRDWGQCPGEPVTEQRGGCNKPGPQAAEYC